MIEELKVAISYIAWKARELKKENETLKVESKELIQDLTKYQNKVIRLEDQLKQRRDLYDQLSRALDKRKVQNILDESYILELKKLLKANSIDYSHVRGMSPNTLESVKKGIEQAEAANV